MFSPDGVPITIAGRPEVLRWTFGAKIEHDKILGFPMDYKKAVEAYRDEHGLDGYSLMLGYCMLRSGSDCPPGSIRELGAAIPAVESIDFLASVWAAVAFGAQGPEGKEKAAIARANVESKTRRRSASTGAGSSRRRSTAVGSAQTSSSSSLHGSSA